MSEIDHLVSGALVVFSLIGIAFSDFSATLCAGPAEGFSWALPLPAPQVFWCYRFYGESKTA